MEGKQVGLRRRSLFQGVDNDDERQEAQDPAPQAQDVVVGQDEQAGVGVHQHEQQQQVPNDQERHGKQKGQERCCGGSQEKKHHRRATTEGDHEVHDDDICCFDWGLLVEPVTLLCGHTFCRHCVGIMLDDAMAKNPRSMGSMKCPLCCRSLPALLPQPNVRLRNELRTRYPILYQSRLDTVTAQFGGEGDKSASRGMSPEDLQGLLAAHQRRLGRNGADARGAADAAGAPQGIMRFLQGDDAEDDIGELGDDPMADPVVDAVELFQAELLYIWRARRWACWFLALLILVLGFTPLRLAALTDKAAHVESILRIDTWNQWWSLASLGPGQTFGLGSENFSMRDDSDHHRQGEVETFPGSELLATVYMYPSWGWIERISRGVEGCILDVYRVLHKASPATLITAFPGLAMAAYALCHSTWSAPFRELVAFLAIEGEIRQLMAVWTVLTIPTRVPRDPRDIPPLSEMPAYAWTVLSLTLAQGAYLLACEMIGTLLDIVALSPMLLALTKGQCWRNEASLVATVLVRFWLMLREDLGLFRRILGRRTHSEATILRLFILTAVFTAPLWASKPLYNPTDSVSTLANAGDEILSEVMDEVSKAVTA